MKKLIAVSAVAALAATALSAEVAIGSWGRALWAIGNGVYVDDGEVKEGVVTDVHQSWGGAAPRVGLGVSGSSDNVGFALDIHANGFDQNFPADNAYIWVKPIEQVKISVGKIDDGTYATGAGFGLWDWDRLGCVNNGAGDAWTFGKHFQKNGDTGGLNIQATPVEGLFLGASLPVKLSNYDFDPKQGEDESKEDYEKRCDSFAEAFDKEGPRVFANMFAHNADFVAGYTIEGVGTIKAALTTKDAYKNKNGSKKSHVGINAAFDLTAVENLFASVGVIVDTAKQIKDGQELDLASYKDINAYARYGVNEQLTLHALIGTKVGGEYINKDGKKTSGFGFTGGVGVAYGLDNSVTLEADVRYASNIYYKNSDKDNMDNLTLGLGVTKGYSNGKLGIAFEGSTNNGGHYVASKELKGDKFSWEIPVKFEYSF